MLMKKKKIASPENLAIFLLLMISRQLMCGTIWFSGKYVNGAIIIVDGGLWLSRPRHIPKEEVKALSKVVEKKVRASGVGVPSSKLWWHLWLCSSSVCSVSYMSICCPSIVVSLSMSPVHAHGLLAGWAENIYCCLPICIRNGWDRYGIPTKRCLLPNIHMLSVQIVNERVILKI